MSERLSMSSVEGEGEGEGEGGNVLLFPATRPLVSEVLKQGKG